MNSLLMKLCTLMCVLAVHAGALPVEEVDVKPVEDVDVKPVEDFQVKTVEDFDMEKMAGEWYVVGYASNAQWFVSSKDDTKLSTNIFKPGHDGHMDLVYFHKEVNGTCSNSTFHTMKTDTPGRFTYHSEVWNNDNDMRIVEVKYDDYALVHTIKTSGNTSEVLNNLFSRNNETSADLQDMFSKFSTKTGILPENILILPKTM